MKKIIKMRGVSSPLHSGGVKLLSLLLGRVKLYVNLGESEKNQYNNYKQACLRRRV